jgi:hypothetical protein
LSERNTRNPLRPPTEPVNGRGSVEEKREFA